MQNVPARRTDSWGFNITKPVAMTLLADRLKHDGELILQQTNGRGQARTIAKSNNSGRSAERIELTLEPGRYNIILSNHANKTNSYRLTARTAEVAAPSRVEATVWSGTSVHVRWLDNSHNETGFRVQQWIRGRWKNVAEANRNATAAVVSGHLQPGHEPIFRVVARRGEAAIASTNTMSVTMTGSDESGWYRVKGISSLTKGEAGFIKKNASLTIHPDFVDPNDSSRSKWVHAANWQEAVRASLKAEASFEVTFDRGSLKKGDTVIHNNIASQGSFEINTAQNVRAKGLNSTRGASEIQIPPMDPDAKLVAIEDSYQAGYQVDNDYDDWWWEVQTERLHMIGFYGAGTGGFGNQWMGRLGEEVYETELYGSEQRVTALRDFLGKIDRNGDGTITESEIEGNVVRVFGYSRGGIAAIRFTRDLRQAGVVADDVDWGAGSHHPGFDLEAPVPIQVLIAIDAEQGVGLPQAGPAGNVQRFVHFYQRRGGYASVDLYEAGTSNYVDTIPVGTLLSSQLRGDEFSSNAGSNSINRVDIGDWTDVAVRHPWSPGFDGELTGKDVNHDMVPFFAYDYVLPELLAD